MTDHELDAASFDKLTRHIYAAVFDQARWQDFLEELHKVTGGVRTHLFGFDIPAGISLGLVASGYEPGYIDTYNEYYGAINSWAPGFAQGKPGLVLPSEVMCAKEDLFQTEFYHDWVKPQENVAAGGGAMIFKDETRMLAFGGNIRLKDEEKLESAWLRTVGFLIPHLQQAFEISRMLAGQSLEIDLLRKGAVNQGAAVMLLADNAFLLYANEAAQHLVHEGKVLSDDRNGRVSFRDPTAAHALEHRLKQLRSGERPLSSSFIVGGEEGGRRRTCRLVRFVPEDHSLSPFPLVFGYVRTALLVTLSEVQPGNDEGVAVLASKYRLTNAETAVVLGIADGLTPAAMAEQRSVSVHTIRNQLKSAMAKTGMRRQIDLVRMFQSLRAPGR